MLAHFFKANHLLEGEKVLFVGLKHEVGLKWAPIETQEKNLSDTFNTYLLDLIKYREGRRAKVDNACHHRTSLFCWKNTDTVLKVFHHLYSTQFAATKIIIKNCSQRIQQPKRAFWDTLKSYSYFSLMPNWILLH